MRNPKTEQEPLAHLVTRIDFMQGNHDRGPYWKLFYADGREETTTDKHIVDAIMQPKEATLG